MIKLGVLGTLVLKDSNGEDIQSVLAQPKRVALLTYLALARPRGYHRRDKLLALFWPEQDEQHARWALNQALRQLRNALGKEVMPSRGDEEVGIDFQALACDVLEFEAALTADDPGRALGLYRGELLDGFHVSGCGEFGRWLEEERVWLRRRAARAATLLAGKEEARGERIAAGHWARRAFALASDDESEVCNLITVLDRLGDRAGAIETYESFARRLREEYEAEPAPETRATIAAVRTRQVESESSVGSTKREALPGEPAMAQPKTSSLPSPQPPVGRSRRTVVLMTSFLGLLALGTLISGPRPPRSVGRETAVSRNTIAVLPFSYRGSPEFAYLGEGLVDLLSANLNGAGDIRTVDPYAVFALMRREGDHRAEPEKARTVGSQLGAGAYVLGEVVEAAGRLHVNVRLYALPEVERTLVSATVQGRPTQLFQLVDGLTAQLIAQLSGGPAANLSRLAALTTDSLAALKAYLEGERHFRNGRMDSTVRAMQRAIQIDSSFALAYYRMASATMWTNHRPGADEAADQALRLAHRLSDRDRRLIGALSAWLHGRLREAERMYRETLTRHPDDLEANYQLADLIFHHAGDLMLSWLDSREYFEQVLRIEPYHQGSLYHLSNIAARERTYAQLDSLTGRVLEIVPLPPGWFYRAQRAVVFRDTAEVERFIAVIRKFSDDVAQPVLGFIVFTTGDLAVGRRLWQLLTEPSRSRGVRLLAHLTLAKIELIAGRWRAAQIELDSAGMLDPETTLEHRAVLSLWPNLQVPRSELLQLRNSLWKWKGHPEPTSEATRGVEHAPAHPYLRLYLLGLLSARLGDYEDTGQHAAEITRRAGGSFAPAFVRQLGRTLRAEIARGQGRLDEALAIMDSLSYWTPVVLELSGESPFYAYEYESIMRAELLYAAGRYDDALRAYQSLADGLFHSGAPAHLRMAEIYERKGNRQKAAEHYTRFVELWKDCDPEFRPLVEDARRRASPL